MRIMEGWHMIVITRNGKTTVVTGWRAWLIGVAIFLAATAFLFVITFVMLGVAITAGAALLIVVPVAMGVAILAPLFRAPRSQPTRPKHAVRRGEAPSAGAGLGHHTLAGRAF
jgi:hypothetical protein